MLSILMDHLETQQGEIDQEQLCTLMGISPETLQTLLDILVRKGRILLPEESTSACAHAEICPSNSLVCPGPESCSRILVTSKTISITIQDKPELKAE